MKRLFVDDLGIPYPWVIVVTVLVLVMGMAIGISAWASHERKVECQEVGRTTKRPTQYINTHCYILIDNTWIRYGR